MMMDNLCAGSPRINHPSNFKLWAKREATLFPPINAVPSV